MGAGAGQDEGIGLSRDDVAQDGNARDPGDVADHMVELEVHEHHRLLHALDVGGGGFDELVAMPHQGAEGGDRGVGPDAPTQQPKGVQLLEPLAVEDVGLAARDAFDGSGVHQQDLESVCFQNLVERDPVDPGRLHRDRLDAAGLEPRGQRFEIVGEAAELSHCRLGPTGGHRHPVARATDVDARRIEMNRLEQLLLSVRARLGAGVSGPLAWHGGLLYRQRVEHPRAGMCRAGILLNGITPGVSPMRLSPHPRTKLANGDRPPVTGRPRPSGAPHSLAATSP